MKTVILDRDNTSVLKIKKILCNELHPIQTAIVSIYSLTIVKMIIREGGSQAVIMAEYLLNIKEWASLPKCFLPFTRLELWPR